MDEDLLGVIMLSFSTVLVCVVTVVTVRAAAAGSLDRNGAVGLRTRHTRATDAAWSAGHAAALPRVRWSVPVAVCAVVAAIVLLVLGWPEWGIVAGLVGVLLQVAVRAARLRVSDSLRAPRAGHRRRPRSHRRPPGASRGAVPA